MAKILDQIVGSFISYNISFLASDWMFLEFFFRIFLVVQATVVRKAKNILIAENVKILHTIHFNNPFQQVKRILTCVASVSVRLRSKERPRNGIFGVLPARK